MTEVKAVEPVAAPVVTGCEAVRTEAAKYSDWDANIITAIAEAESHCDTQATGDTTLTYEVNGRTYGYSVGALQVRILPGREECDTHDIAQNIQCAYRIWQDRPDYRAWTMFTNGEYIKYLKK